MCVDNYQTSADVMQKGESYQPELWAADKWTPSILILQLAPDLQC